ncbi:hypothetical protein Tcan_10939 [Toxocara canis]|uniref:Uncharacterized protein n=1 Tax=Toxocara canis TaxID=6265 RepID=A0A0B2V6V6_TOXCA|nr:hypothetical protein Tcan_10939 [Toxocara canis]
MPETSDERSSNNNVYCRSCRDQQSWMMEVGGLKELGSSVDEIIIRTIPLDAQPASERRTYVCLQRMLRFSDQIGRPPGKGGLSCSHRSFVEEIFFYSWYAMTAIKNLMHGDFGHEMLRRDRIDIIGEMLPQM